MFPVIVVCEQVRSAAGPHDRQWAEVENKRQAEAVPRGHTRYPFYGWKPEPLERIKFTLGINAEVVSLVPVGWAHGIEPPKAGQITVYLVNDTNDFLKIPCQDNDIYLMLEVKLDGKWQRAQRF